MHQLQLSEGKSVFLASDFHLGWPSFAESQERERKILRWIDCCQERAELFVFLGDIFDFWFEHKHVIPKGGTRFLGKIAELTDKGIGVVFFVGNHDLWMRDYFTEELGVTVFHRPQQVRWNDTDLLLAHGDGLGPGDRKYKFVKKNIFLNPVLLFIFEHLWHPNWALGLAHYWSNHSKSRNQVILSPEEQTTKIKQAYAHPENEWLYSYAQETESQQHHDYYVFGHRHIPLDMEAAPDSRYVNLGEWLNFYTYGEFDGKKLHLKKFEE